ncbi:MAG: LamG domain-containing protein [Sedimentisphaerales bacterium]|nr:LamG domain-containing protein [Sedimentisphaerales bacterium]
MVRKLIPSMIIILCFAGVSVSYGQIYWSGLAEPDTPSWHDPCNWVGNTVPTSSDAAHILIDATDSTDPNRILCVVDTGTTADCSELHIGEGGSLGAGQGHVEVYGTLNVGGVLRVCSWTDWGPDDLLYIDGIVNVGGELELSYVTIEGGELNVDGIINMGEQNSWSDRFELMIHGGVVTTAQFNMEHYYPARAEPLTDITTGELRISGNVVSDISTYVSNGWMTAYGGDSDYEIFAQYNSGDDETVVIAREKTGLPSDPCYPANNSYVTWESFIYTSDGPVLEWSAGEGVESYHIYFGTDYVAVDEADPCSPEYRGEQDVAETTYPIPQGEMAMDETYFWRIDQVVGGFPLKGYVWQFTTNSFRIVDEFEWYGNTSAMLEYWDQGTGSTINRETDMVIGGAVAMRLSYDNSSSPYISEVSRDCFLTDPNELRCYGDWTAYGAQILTLTLHGNLTFTEDLYVTLESNGGAQTGTVYHDVPLELNQGEHEWWRWWYMDLAEFSGQGVDLENVTRMTIGIGNKDAPSAGGAGDIFVDEIRLYPPICIDRDGDADINNDCWVDTNDLEDYVTDWLESSYVVNAAAAETGPVLWYEFNEGTGYEVADSSNNGHTGILNLSSWGTGNGYDGSNCLNMNNDTYVAVPTDVIDPNTWGAELTVSLWIKDPNQTDDDSTLLHYTPGSTLQVWTGSTGHMIFDCGYDSVNEWTDRLTFGESYMLSNPDHPRGVWVHYAFVKSASNAYMRIYQNGVIVAEWDGASGQTMPAPVPGEDYLSVGAWAWSGGSGGFYDGLMDDFRIYDYALSHAQVLQLAVDGGTATSPLTQPLISPADIIKDNLVDLNDFAEISSKWLSEAVFP